jgi:hypothetical protein
MKRTALVLINSDLNSKRGRVSSRFYKAVLEEYLLTILKVDSIFIQDKARIHKAQIIKEFFIAISINVID